MAIESSTTLLKQVSALFQLGTLTGLADGALLDRFRLGPARSCAPGWSAEVCRADGSAPTEERSGPGDGLTGGAAAGPPELFSCSRFRSTRRSVPSA